MSNQPSNKPNNISGEILSWVLIVICFSAFWPLGLFLLIKKLTSYGKQAKTAARPQNSSSFREAPGLGGKSRTAAPAGGNPATAAKPTTGRSVHVLLLILGIILLLVSFSHINTFVDALAYSGFASQAIFQGVRAVFYLLGSAASFVSSSVLRRRSKRFDKLAAVFGTKDVMSVSELSKACGTDLKRTRRDLEAMIDRGFFGPTAYLDKGLDSLVVSPDAAENARQAAFAAEKASASSAKSTQLSQYDSVIQELRELNAAIEDGPISEKIDHIEDITIKIFGLVSATPAKVPQIRKFMDYYLPTTLKLLRSYSVLEKQGIEGENITATKEKIGGILDTLSKGYEQQLDQLFKADAMDISSDIEVLETMMKSDGLNSGGMQFQSRG